MKYIITFVFAVFSILTIVGCAHTPTNKGSAKQANAKKHAKKPSAVKKEADVISVQKSEEDGEGYTKKLIEKLEKEKSELEVQNSMLMQALSERKKAIHKLPKGEVVQQFPEFEELIFDQAKTAYREKDEERLQEAIRIMRANQPHSQTIESMFFWLAQLQENKNLNSQALVTYDEFIKIFPNSEYAPQALFLKGKLYEKLNLKPQALKIYSDIRKNYPHSREKHFAEAKLEIRAEAKLENKLRPQTKRK
ncbi:MAG: tetratricopeptide repeat protein [Bdellovibrionota bacterium]